MYNVFTMFEKISHQWMVLFLHLTSVFYLCEVKVIFVLIDYNYDVYTNMKMYSKSHELIYILTLHFKLNKRVVK